MSLKNDQPILMGDEMVRAILEGRKTQTRRLSSGPVTRSEFGRLRDVNEKHDIREGAVHVELDDSWVFYDKDGTPLAAVRESWRPGMALWVKEPWSKVETQEGIQKDLIRFCADDAIYRRNGDGGISLVTDCDRKKFAAPRWVSKIFLPHWAARLKLEIISVKIERLQQLTVEDVLAEGIDPEVWEYQNQKGAQRTYYRATDYAGLPKEIASFAAYWDSFNATEQFDGQANAKPMPWAMNPWVFCITFKRIA